MRWRVEKGDVLVWDPSQISIKRWRCRRKKPPGEDYQGFLVQVRRVDTTYKPLVQEVGRGEREGGSWKKPAERGAKISGG